jgi:deoxycytidine triphosphate deaminase
MDKLLVVHPCNIDDMTGVGYDLNIGYYIQINRRESKGEIVKCFEAKNDSTGNISLSPDHFVVIVTKEFVYLSCRVAATFHSKSRLAAQGLFLNSTTVDPNWNGRLIFLLYNASNTPVDISLNESFVTMVVQYVERRSFLKPKESKVVLDKYINGFSFNVSDVLRYVMEKPLEYETRVEYARRFSTRGELIIMVLLWFNRYIVPNYKHILYTIILFLGIYSIYVALTLPTWFLNLGINKETLYILGSIASLIGLFPIISRLFIKNK